MFLLASQLQSWFTWSITKANLARKPFTRLFYEINLCLYRSLRFLFLLCLFTDRPTASYVPSTTTINQSLRSANSMTTKFCTPEAAASGSTGSAQAASSATCSFQWNTPLTAKTPQRKLFVPSTAGSTNM